MITTVVSVIVTVFAVNARREPPKNKVLRSARVKPFSAVTVMVGVITVPLAMASPVAANTVIIPYVIRYAYVNVEESLSFLFLTVGVGEALSVFLFGTLLYFALRPIRYRIFGETW